jgi:hypothetical protein
MAKFETEKIPSAEDLGPQYPKDDPLTARMRLHQSWYRSRVLKVPYGVGPKASNKTYYGNMLTREDGERGLNFLSPHIFQIARRRLAAGPAPVDSFRLLCSMLSSQAVTINLFGPLVDNKDLAKRLVEELLSVPVKEVLRVDLQYTPEPAKEYLNDRTAFDVFVEYLDQDGQPSFAGIETVLAGPLSDRVYANPSYQKWTEHGDAPFKEGIRAVLSTPELNQLWRGHLLATALRLHPDSIYGSGHYLLLYPAQNMEIGQAAAQYRHLLKPTDHTFAALTLQHVVERWQKLVENSAYQSWLEAFRLRYLELSASEEAIKE